MRFYHDYDWTARVVERGHQVRGTAIKCDECYKTIGVGEMAYHVFMQEHEECQTCDSFECECAEGQCCACEKPDYGETFEYDRCEECDKFLQAIEAAEIDEDCDPSESRPALTSLREDISNAGLEASKKYWLKAVVMFPELKASGYLGKLWKRIFV